MVFIAPYYSFSWYRQLPSVDLIDDRILSCTKIYDRKMRLLYEICPDIRVEPITINQVPENVINSTLAVEDTEFYSHKGFRILSLLRAAKETFLKKNVQGGSTITQQLV
ncbi:transglycosylase domain-containing protein, partial [candidate division WWE3 bacterium]|nr:transglycosylase domain-containing protein [candidate division WWE3 bacterium]